ncbi:hypothetical protein ACFE04_027902 [Oxalis oulophora]
MKMKYHSSLASSSQSQKEEEEESKSMSSSSSSNWTPSMERYFILLLLDQLPNNRLGHSFHKHAWIHILTMFNSRFRTTYDNIHIFKFHYSLLLNQYNDINQLLNQPGFSWDHRTNMVVADAHTWNAYIQVHPEADSFWNKSFGSFNDLCSIFAYTKADGRFCLSSHDVDLDEDFSGLNAGGIALASGESSKPDWRPSMDRFFVKILLDQLRKSNKRNKNFSLQAWKNMLTLFNENFRTQYEQKILRRRYEKLFECYVDLRSMLKQKGFSWDEKQQMLVADDSTWEKYINMYPDARSYRKRSLLNYHDLALLFESLSNDGHEDHIHQDQNSEHDNVEVKAEKINYAGDSSGGNDALVTHWTTAMDNYLTDLLLDQARKGNKVNHEFISQAWIEIVTTFNAKFGSHYPIDVLKNRYEYLRKLFDDLSILLEQKGISWDDTQEMVTATDSVWDSCIKAYPYAQSYRNKSMPNYLKLLFIYGEESDYGGNNHLACLDSGNPSGLQLHANGDFPETYWTSLMDRYLIDLLLEQVRKGHRQDWVFRNDAWIDMTLSFVERFGIRYDKNILISHYKSLSKQYNDIKDLVGQRGFSWDEGRQMVAASNKAWNACIEKNPDAKAYRTELQPNYNDLSLIFGNPASNRMASGVDITCNSDGANHNNGNCLSTDWTPLMDRYFIDQMLDHVRQGSMIDKKFKKWAWVDMVAKFSKEFGTQYKKDVLKSRFVSLRERFDDMKILLNQNGFFWDEMQQMIIAGNNLWRAYVKRYPDAQLYWNKPQPNYNDLFLIYGNANSEEQHDYLESGGDEDEYPASSNSCMDDMDDGVDNIYEDLVSPAREFEMPDQKRKRKSRSPTSSNPKRVVRSVKYEREEAHEQKTLSRGVKEEECNNRSIEMIVEALQAIPGMENEIFLEACSLLEDEKKVKKFLSMDVCNSWLMASSEKGRSGVYWMVNLKSELFYEYHGKSMACLRVGNYRTGFGAILSAGTFVSSFVVGFVAIYAAPFSVDAVPFVRDVLFYLVGALFLFYVYLSGEIFVWQAVGFVGFYVFFVGFVFWMDFGLDAGTRVGAGKERNRDEEKALVGKDCEIGSRLMDDKEKLGFGFAQVYDLIDLSTFGIKKCSDGENYWISKLWETPVSVLLKLTIPQSAPSEWSRFYISANIVFCPLALLYACNSFIPFNHPIVFLIPNTHFPLWLVVFSMSSSLALLHYLLEQEPPTTEPLPVVVISFIMSVFWISTIAGELLNCLAALGILLKLPSAILGLTVLAWGNSVGDLVADVAVAKAGHPAMAMAGCFAGPMFNMLVGLGTALVIQTVNVYPHAFKLDFNVGIIIAFVFLMLGLMGSLLVITWSRFRVPRFWGYCLVGLYVVFTAEFHIVTTHCEAMA